MRAVSRPVDYLKGAFDQYPLQESFWIIFLNRRNHAMGRQLLTLGTLTGTLVHPRDVLRAAILSGAAALLAGHNHPSGDPSPSGADIALTRQLKEACAIMDIPLIDHVVVGERDGDPLGKGYFSFREAGLL
jgi:DNA repair protein RadC